MFYFGIDVHSKTSQVCEISRKGTILRNVSLSTTPTGLSRIFRGRARSRIVMEVGCETPWVRRKLEEMGHDVVVVNPRRVRLIAESTLKSDRVDAEVLAQLSRMDPSLVRPVYQRSRAGQDLRSQLRVRDLLVRTRASWITSIRGTLRAHGYRLGSCATYRFLEKFSQLDLDPHLETLLEPLLEGLDQLNQQIESADEALAELSREDELAGRLQTIPGVGPVVSLAFIAWVDRPERFRKSRDVGPGLGLRPWIRESGGRRLTGRITREGDAGMRRLLVQAAHAAFQTQRDSSLRRWATQLSERVGKKKAVVALARKIGVLMHRLWTADEEFQAFPKAA